MKSISTTLATTLVIFLGTFEIAQARTITEISPPGGLGQGGTFCIQVQTPVNTGFPNNNNTISPSPNQILNFPGLSCTPKTFQVLAPIDTPLFVQSSGGITEYFVTETVVNNTNLIWTGFDFELGTRVKGKFVSFEDLISIPELIPPSFDTAGTPNRDPIPTSSNFTSLVHQNYSLGWSGGSVAPGEAINFSFSLDVPDDIIPLDSYKNFLIRQVPRVTNLSFIPAGTQLDGNPIKDIGTRVGDTIVFDILLDTIGLGSVGSLDISYNFTWDSGRFLNDPGELDIQEIIDNVDFGEADSITCTISFAICNVSYLGLPLDKRGVLTSILSRVLPYLNNDGESDFDLKIFSAKVNGVDVINKFGQIFQEAEVQPTPETTSTIGFLALGTLGAASTLKRQLKSSKSSEKETTKVS